MGQRKEGEKSLKKKGCAIRSSYNHGQLDLNTGIIENNID